MQEQVPDRTNSRALAAVSVALAGLVWFVFGQTRTFPFVNFDDPEYVYEVPEINHGLSAHSLAWAFTHLPSPNWYPLTNISHMIEASCFGMNAGAWHLTNVFLHLMTAIALFFALCDMTGRGSAIAGIGDAGRDQRSRLQDQGTLWRSAFVAAIFAIHPLRAESVVWITERKDVLSGFFFVTALWAYRRYAERPSIARYAGMSILFGCGLMAKPMVLTLPLVLLLLDAWPLGRAKLGWARLVGEKVPLLALSTVSAILTAAGGSRFRAAAEHLPFGARVANALVSYLIYIWQMIWPAKLAVFYPSTGQPPAWQVAFAIIVLAAATTAAILLRRSRPYLLVGWLWYVVMMLPVIGLVQVNLQAHADRYTYLPQIGLYLAIAWGVYDLSSGWVFRKQILTGTALVAVGLLAGTARVQAATWKNSETLWRHAIAVTDNNYFAHASLADLLLRNGKIDEAIVHCREALRVHPNDADAENNFGLALLQKGETNEAAAHLKRCLAINPEHMNGQANLAWILATSPDPATRDGDKAVELAKNLLQRAGHPNAIVLRTLAAGYAATGRFSDAIDVAEKALEMATASGNAGLAADLRSNLDSYRANQPLRTR